MTTRTTSNGYKVTITNEERIEDYHFYDDLGVFCFKDVSRDYKLLNDLDLHEWEIDYLVWNKSKEEIIEEDDGYICNDDFVKLDDMKEKNIIIWLVFRDYWGGCISVWESTNRNWEYDGFLMVNKWDENFAKSALKSFNARLRWEIYVASVYEPKYYKSEEWDGRVKYWEYIDGWTGFIDYDDAKNSFPEYVWELQNESDCDNWNEFEFC